MATSDLIVARRGWAEGCRASWGVPRLTGTVQLPGGAGTTTVTVTRPDPSPVVESVALSSDDGKGTVTTLLSRTYPDGMHYNYPSIDKEFDFEIPYGATRRVTLTVTVTFSDVLGIAPDGREVAWEGALSTVVTDSVVFSQVDDPETWGSESAKRLNIPYIDVR